MDIYCVVIGMGNYIKLYFSTVIGAKHNRLPYESPNKIIFREVIVEIAKKLSIDSEQIAISSKFGDVLTKTDFNKTVEVIVEEYGDSFDVINRGVVG